ncbi:retrovirus-related pol polyprotein from transposon TNT 1-94 [Tanacetum coccineum]
MCTYLKNMKGKKLKDLKNKSFNSIQKMFDRAFKRVNTFVDFRTDLVKGSSKRAGEELEQENEEEVVIDAIPLATKPPTIVDWKIHKEGKNSYFQIIRADRSSKMYLVFSKLLKSVDKKDLVELYKLVKAKYRSTRPVEDMDFLLRGNLKTMFEPHVEDEILKFLRINEVFGSILLVIMELLMEKLDDFGDKYQYQLNAAEGVNAAKGVNIAFVRNFAILEQSSWNFGFLGIVEIVILYLDYDCSKHMTGLRDKLINFVSKFIEGLGHNLFSVGKFCDSNLKVAFRKHTCFVRNLEGIDLLSRSRGSNLYTISMDKMMKSSPIFLLSKASKIKSWLWHRHLSHLNFGTKNQLAKQGLVKDLPKLKFTKGHLSSACQMGKRKKEPNP